MRRRYAHYAVVMGVLHGVLVAVSVSIIGYKLIRAFENKTDDVADKAGDAISHEIYDKKHEKEGKEGSQDLADRYK